MDEQHHLYHRIFCTSCGRSFDVPVSCGNRFCAVCSYQRKKRVIRKVNALLAYVSPPAGYTVKFITLTIPNQAELRPMAYDLIRSFRRLRQRSFWRNRVRGGAYFIQVTGRPGNWHAHLHILSESRYFPVRRLSALWSKVSPGKIVHIKNVPLKQAVAYVTAYVADTELSGSDASSAGRELRGLRLFQPFGNWHDICRIAPSGGFCCPSCGAGDFYVTSDINRAFRGQRPSQIGFYTERPPPP
jgi:hypothetical protein